MANTNLILKADLRTETGKKAANQLRTAGSLPAVIYGPGLKENVNISISYREFEKLYKTTTRNKIFTIDTGKEKYQVIVKEFKIHPLSRTYMHIDFYAIDKDREFTTIVPLNYTGTPLGVKEGGSLFIMKRSLKVRATATTLPEKIDIDIANLKIAQYMIVREILEGKDYKIMTHEGNVLVEIK